MIGIIEFYKFIYFFYSIILFFVYEDYYLRMIDNFICRRYFFVYIDIKVEIKIGKI